MHCAQSRIEITPAAVSIQCHGKTTIGPLDAYYAGISRARRFDGVGLHHVVILLPYPTLAANIGTGKELLEACSEIAVSTELYVLRFLPRHWWFPTSQRPFVH